MPEYIEREELLKRIDMVTDTVGFPGHLTIKQIVSRVPTADVAPVVHGRWVKVPVPLRKGKYAPECSHCKQRLKPLNGELIYCPVCGAKMDLENETEEK